MRSLGSSVGAAALWIVLVTSGLFPVASWGALRTIEPTAVGAVVTNPWLTYSEAGERITVATLTNGDSGNFVTLHVSVLSDRWRSVDFECQLSPMETTYFLFQPSDLPDESRLTSECSSSSTFNLNIIQTRLVPGNAGLVVFKNDTHPADNSLIGDFTVIDFGAGFAFSANAWHIGAVAGSEDQDLAFDGIEYDRMPGTLVSTFIAPDDDVTAELLIYNLNGQPNRDAPAKLSGLVFDDDENALSGFVDYDCFSLLPLSAIFGTNVDRRFGPAGSPYLVGHFSLFARYAPTSYDAEGLPLVVPSIGWLLQTSASGGDIGGGAVGSSIAGNAAWSRQLLVTTDPLNAYFQGEAQPRP